MRQRSPSRRLAVRLAHGVREGGWVERANPGRTPALIRRSQGSALLAPARP